MDRLKFIVREVNKLLETSHNLLSFDALDSIHLLQIVSDILHAIDAGPKLKAGHDLSQTVLSILSSLQSVKYVPPDNANPVDFYESVTTGDTNVIYPILEWVLTNQSKIKKRAYLARYADKLPIPSEAAEDPDVIATYKNYERMIEEFWSNYKENVIAKKNCLQAIELQSDIKKMKHDLSNVVQRTQAQWEKLTNIQNKENLIYAGKIYRASCFEQRNLTKQIKENLASISQLEFQVKNLEDKWSRRGRQPIVDINVFQMILEESRVNKIFFEAQLPEELDNQKELVTIMEKSLEGSCPSREHLLRSVNIHKDEVQRLMNEKLSLYANTEDKLGPFRKQGSAISQKKLELSNEIKEVKRDLAHLDEKVRDKEITLFNVVGGEILHGEELKHFIATLREKSVTYKQLRSQLQSLSAELGIENRTLDVLKSIDSSIDTAYFNSHAGAASKEKYQINLSMSNSTTEAKQIYKEVVQEIDILKSDIAQVHNHLLSSKKDTDDVNQKLNEVKEVFETATRSIVFQVQQLKEKIRDHQTDIELLEKTWKTTTQNLDKSEYIFNRLIDDFITNSEDAATGSDSYLTMLTKKKEDNQKLMEQAQNAMRKLEENKKREQETIEFFKHTEYIIMRKLEEN